MITIWTQESCPECELAISALRKSGLIHAIRDADAIRDDPDRDEVYAQLALQGMAFPVIRADDGFLRPGELGPRIAAALIGKEQA